MRYLRLATILLAGAWLLVACGTTPDSALTQPVATAVPAPAATQLDATAAPAATQPNATAVPALTRTTPTFGMSGWKTDFTKHSVPLSEILAGGPPRDGIPPIDQPTFVPVEEANGWLNAREPVIHFAIGDDVRAYPLQILIWHEIVNDVVDGIPVMITFCPLCNTAIAFDRRIDGKTYDFGTSGNVRKSDLVMWDRQTESWWQQITGEAIVGALTGTQLSMLPATIVAWEDFRRDAPQGRVLSRETGINRDYGSNPYAGYDRVDQSPFLYDGQLDDRLLPMERIVSVSGAGEDVAYPFSLLRERRVVTDTVNGRSIVVFWQDGATSALDAVTIAEGRDVGATGVFVPLVDGRALTFTAQDDRFVDAETGSQWNILGRAVAGPLAGNQLEPIVHANHFWFAWAAFKPQTRIAR